MIRKILALLILLFVTSHAMAGAMRAPKFKTPSVGHMTKQPGYQAKRAANGDYRVSYDAKQPVGSAANDPSFAASVAYDLAKGKVVDTIVNGAKKGKISPAQIAAGVIGTLLLDEMIDAGLEWMEDQRQWLKTPLDPSQANPANASEFYYPGRNTIVQINAWLPTYAGSDAVLISVNKASDYEKSPQNINGVPYYIANVTVTYKRGSTKYTLDVGTVYALLPATKTPATDAEIDAAASKVADTADPNQLIQEVTKIDQIEIMGNEQQTAIITNPEVWGEVTDGEQTIRINPDGSQTITTKTHQDRWIADPATQVTPALDPSINVKKDTITTETTQTKNPDGSLGPSTTTTTTSPQTNPNSDSDKEPEEDYPDPEDEPFAKVPEFWEKKYPEGMKGVWNQYKPTPENTKFLQSIKSMFPSFGGGSCPAWTISLNVGKGMNYGSGNISIPCDILQICGLILLATAAFTARKIIFG